MCSWCLDLVPHSNCELEMAVLHHIAFLNSRIVVQRKREISPMKVVFDAIDRCHFVHTSELM